MAKRDDGRKRPNGDTAKPVVSAATTAEPVEQRIVAFAEELGRIAGMISARAEGWMDRDTLARQMASVRDGATDLVKHLRRRTPKPSMQKPSSGAAQQKGRGGGVVDAPGKKHRKPAPADPDEKVVKSQAAKLRAKRTTVKTNQRRG